MNESDKRLQNPNITKNPFTGRIKEVTVNQFVKTYVVVMDPLYPPFYWFGLIGAIVPLFFTGIRFSLWLLPGLILFSTGIFWSSLFVYLGLRVGLYKKGYKGEIHKISRKELIRRMVLNNI